MNMKVDPKICEGKSGVVSKEVVLDAVGLSEALVVRLNVTCDCQCEMPGEEVYNEQRYLYIFFFCFKIGTFL